MLDTLRDEVLESNLALVQHGLVKLTWGNVSGIDREHGLVVIKPSGVPYARLRSADLVVIDLEGTVVEGSLRPSSDTATHVALYRAFEELGGVVHTHSPWATAFAQAERPIPLLGTTHADLMPGPIPLARRLTREEITTAYEKCTGDILIETVGSSSTATVPGALAPGHGVFTWGASPLHAVEHAVTVEEVAKMALLSLLLDASASTLDQAVIDKHHSRKHGPGATYGQRAAPSPDLPA